MDRAELDELLADARLYVGSGNLDAAQAAIDMLTESIADLAHDSLLANETLTLIDLCVRRFMGAGRRSAADKALDVFFGFARHLKPDIGAIDAAKLATYREALLASGSSAVPAVRAMRHANLQTLFSTVSTLDGWVAECGCAAGLSFLQLCSIQTQHAPSWQGEQFQVFDSFEGLSEPGSKDLDITGMETSNAQRVLGMTRAGNMAFGFEAVSNRILTRFPRVELHRGWLPASLDGIAEHAYRFVHVDVDLYEPTLGCFEYFYPRLVRGGMIVTDDYNWPGGRRAIDEFCTSYGLTPRLTSTNQAYLVAG
jgi:O-methyltransferase